MIRAASRPACGVGDGRPHISLDIQDVRLALKPRENLLFFVSLSQSDDCVPPKLEGIVRHSRDCRVCVLPIQSVPQWILSSHTNMPISMPSLRSLPSISWFPKHALCCRVT